MAIWRWKTAFEQGNASYCIWLYNPKTGRFVFSEELSRLTNPSPDAKTHAVSYVKENCSICYRRESFRWAKGTIGAGSRRNCDASSPGAAASNGMRVAAHGQRRKERENGVREPNSDQQCWSRVSAVKFDFWKERSLYTLARLCVSW
jgi:hypothetical protein